MKTYEHMNVTTTMTSSLSTEFLVNATCIHTLIEKAFTGSKGMKVVTVTFLTHFNPVLLLVLSWGKLLGLL